MLPSALMIIHRRHEIRHLSRSFSRHLDGHEERDWHGGFIVIHVTLTLSQRVALIRPQTSKARVA